MRVKGTLDVPASRNALLQVCAALNAWRALFDSEQPKNSAESRNAIRKNLGAVGSAATRCKENGQACIDIIDATVEGLEVVPWKNEEQRNKFLVLFSLQRAGDNAIEIQRRISQVLSWSNGSWSDLRCEKEVKDSWIGCRNGLDKAYPLLELDVRRIGIDMASAELDHVHQLLGKDPVTLALSELDQSQQIIFSKLLEFNGRGEFLDLYDLGVWSPKEPELGPSPSSVFNRLNTIRKKVSKHGFYFIPSRERSDFYWTKRPDREIRKVS